MDIFSSYVYFHRCNNITFNQNCPFNGTVFQKCYIINTNTRVIRIQAVYENVQHHTIPLTHLYSYSLDSTQYIPCYVINSCFIIYASCILCSLSFLNQYQCVNLANMKENLQTNSPTCWSAPKVTGLLLFFLGVGKS